MTPASGAPRVVPVRRFGALAPRATPSPRRLLALLGAACLWMAVAGNALAGELPHHEIIAFLLSGGGDVMTLSGTYQIDTVPVPAAVWLMGSALGLLGYLRRRVTA